MTNREQWNIYTDGLSSPQNFINWSFVYLISASLQRRVWIQSGESRLYPNTYTVLVGKPGIGKGIIIRYIQNILGHHKMSSTPLNAKLSPEEQTTLAAIVNADKIAGKESVNSGPSEDDPLLIPCGSDATTYEALIQQMAKSYRRKNFAEFSEKHGREIMKIYGHSSLAILLEEMASLFRKNTESMVNFALQAYDCGDKYEYRTKTAGIDRVLRLCLNFLAGTTPDFMQEVFDDRLLSQGFSSRAFFIYAAKNRKHQFFIPPITKEQEAAREILRKHVLSLTDLYGPVIIASEDIEWLEAWWTDYQEHPEKRASSSNKMEAYYARKNIHVMKVAMSLHFSESVSMHITRDKFEAAMHMLHEEEKTMHLALSFSGNNPQAKLAKKILEMLRQRDLEYSIILCDCFDHGSQRDIDEVLEYLAKTGQVETYKFTDEDTQNETLKWRMKK